MFLKNTQSFSNIFLSDMGYSEQNFQKHALILSILGDKIERGSF